MNVFSKLLTVAALLAVSSASAPVFAQDADPAEEEATALEEVIITGSRIRRNPLDEAAPIMEFSQEDLERTGLTNLGDQLRQLPISGSAVNSQFNVPGNSGFPQDGQGIGAGAVQLSLRNVGAKRTLVLVNGRRWIAGASASGVPVAVDLNTIPDNVIERIEILQDGASAIYGSDALGGVLNVITKDDFDGFQLDFQTGQFISENDGEATEVAALWGGGNDRTRLMLSASFKEEKGVDTWDRSRSAYPNPDATSCNVSGSFCSSFTPQGRFVLGPNFDFQSITLNDGVLNDGGANIPVWDPNDPDGGPDFHAFTNADRFNYNGPGYNYLRTPNKRVNFYADVRHELTDAVELFATISYTNRTSATKAAPEPLCLGNGCGNRILDNIVVSALNPYNPFGMDLSVANGNLEFMGRRPIESGGRLFFQDVDTYMASVGLQGAFSTDTRNFYWDLTASYGDNDGFQEKFNSHNAANLAVALGDPAVCAQVPGCVPFNFFGGQGPDGNGSFTQEMLDYVTYTQRDASDQTLVDYAFNLTGDVMETGAGTMGFAVGVEYREHEGSFRPDPIAERGETAGIPSGRTVGEFDVTEFYGELVIPLLSEVAGADLLELNVAARSSDYSTSGSESTYKTGVLWRPTTDLSIRGSVSTGFRAPGIGELFGGAAREDFTFFDPCADYTAVVGSLNGGRDTPQPADIQANCAALGVPAGVAQTNPQLSAVSAGNENLQAEESDAFTFGFVWTPEWSEGLSWSDGMTLSVDYYDLEIDNAVESRDPGDLIDACVATTDPQFCDGVPRTSSGQIGLVNNQLQNIGLIEASGMDIAFTWLGPETSIGQFGFAMNATWLDEYIETVRNPDGTLTVNDLTGQHTDETFARAFPEWRIVSSVNWNYDRWNGSLAYRWTDNMTTDGGGDLDSVGFTDLRLSYVPSWFEDSLRLTIGVNNLFDEDPPVCFPCGVIGLSTVSHDLPGQVGYIRLTYLHD